jgi:hypothetical protein
MFQSIAKATLIAGMAGLCATAIAQSGNDRVSQFTRGDGTQVTVVSGQPQSRPYGPKPSFDQLDVNRDGIIDRSEAEAYLPLFNDFDNLAHHVRGISRRAYERWDQR